MPGLSTSTRIEKMSCRLALLRMVYFKLICEPASTSIRSSGPTSDSPTVASLSMDAETPMVLESTRDVSF